jgi:putative ABC transport system ATP-binding protein
MISEPTKDGSLSNITVVTPPTEREHRRVAVNVDNVQYSFGEGETRKQVLFDNFLQVHEGEIVIMTGRSGSGKTTLLTLIGTLRGLEEGHIQVVAQELLGASTARIVRLRQKLGFIFQAHNLFESLTAYQNVNMAAELVGLSRRVAKSRIYELLERLDLGHRIHYKPKALSGGQKQRVAVARALVHDPKVILADEPTAALDKESTGKVIELFRERADRGASLIIVTHDDRLLPIADRIVMMEDGHIKSDIAVHEMSAICISLRKFPGFEGLSTTTLTKIADQMSVEKIPPRHTIIRQGDEGDKFYLIREGRVDVLRDGILKPIAELGEGEFFGEQALINDLPRNASIVSSEPCILYSLDKEHFRAVVDQSPSFEEELRATIFKRG